MCSQSGIRRELAKILSLNKYFVGVTARRVQPLDKLRNEAINEFFVQEIDVADAESAMETFTKFIDKMVGVDLVVISAGTEHLNAGLDWALENETIRTNVTGFMASCWFLR